MPVLIPQPTRIQSAGNKPKLIDEYVGASPRVPRLLALPTCAARRLDRAWPDPEFDEYTVVLRGRLCVESVDGPPLSVAAGRAVHTRAGEWVRYSTPEPDGAEYIAVCLPAFSRVRCIAMRTNAYPRTVGELTCDVVPSFPSLSRPCSPC